MNTIEIGYDAEEIKTDKKANMAYWDAVDQLAERYIKELISYSLPTANLEDEEDEILEMGKEITELAVKMLKARGANFPYVDENY